MCLPWSISIVMTHNLAQNAFLIYTGFSASNGGHFSVYSTTFLPFFERKFDAYLRQICLFDAYLRRSGGFMCQMTLIKAVEITSASLYDDGSSLTPNSYPNSIYIDNVTF